MMKTSKTPLRGLRYSLIALLALMCVMLFSVTAFAAQPIPDSAEYGKVLFCDNFESYADGAAVTSPAYTSSRFNSAFGNVSISNGGYNNKIVKITAGDGGSQNFLKIGKSAANQLWPQINLNLGKPLTDGIYTLSYKVIYPDETSGVERASLRFNLVDHNGKHAERNSTVSLKKGDRKINTYTLRIGKNGVNCEYDSVPSFIVFATCDSTTQGSYILIDDLVLYGKTDKAVFTMPDGTELYDYFTVGDTITLPSYAEFTAACGSKWEALGFRKDGVDYAFGDPYTTFSGDSVIGFEVICREKTYPVCFNADTRAATLADICVKDGGTVVLPALDDPDFVGWIVPGMQVYKAGESFVFDYAVLRDDLDSDEHLNVKAIYSRYDTINAPELSGEMPEGPEELTLGELLGYVIDISDSVYGENHVFETEAEAVAYAVEAGLLAEAKSLDDPATISDTVHALANTLPARFYPTLTGKAYPDESLGDLRPYADKLYRAGIITGAESFDDVLSGDALAAMLEKLCDRSKRTVDTKRTIFYFGDSLSDPRPNRTNSWIEKCRPYFDNNIVINNYAIGGYNTGHFVHDDQEGYPSFLDMLDKVKPGDFVFVALGGNDATLWLWKDHPEFADGNQQRDYNVSRDDYQRYTAAARKAGAVPVYIVPTGHNQFFDDKTDKKYEMYKYYAIYDPMVETCMQDANEYYGEYTPILSNGAVIDPMIEEMTPDERKEFFSDNKVHYSVPGAQFVADTFRDIVLDDDNEQLTAIRTHISSDFDLSIPEFDAAAELSYSTDGSVITVSNASAKAESFLFVLAKKDADGRLTEVRVDSDRFVFNKAPAALTFEAADDTAFTFTPSSELYGTLYAFDEALTPVAEPIDIYLEDTSDFIDVSDLLG